MNNLNFYSVENVFGQSNFGYLFFSLSVWERLWYSFLSFLLKMSENDSDNELEVNILGIIRLKIKGVKDVILLICLLSVLGYAYFK